MLKVLLILHVSSISKTDPSFGGVDAVCRSLLEEIERSGQKNIKYKVLAFDPTSSIDREKTYEVSENLTVHHLNTKFKIGKYSGLGLVRAISSIRKYSKSFKPDIVHSHQPIWMLGALSVKRRIGTFHSYKNICRTNVNKTNDFLHVTLLPKLLRYAVTEFTAVSKTIVSEIEKDLNVASTIVYNPIDNFYFEDKKSTSLIKDNLNLVTCSVIIERKNITKIVDFLDYLNRNNIESSLKIVGPKSDRQYYELVKSEISKKGLTDKVTFLGPLAKEEIKKLYIESDLGVFFSEHETFGLVPLEMLAVGLPVLSTSVGIIKEDKNLANSKNLKIIRLDEGFDISQTNIIVEPDEGNYVRDAYSSRSIIKDYESVYLSDSRHYA